jgi:hypothetical protein
LVAHDDRVTALEEVRVVLNQSFGKLVSDQSGFQLIAHSRNPRSAMIISSSRLNR